MHEFVLMSKDEFVLHSLHFSFLHLLHEKKSVSLQFLSFLIILWHLFLSLLDMKPFLQLHILSVELFDKTAFFLHNKQILSLLHNLHKVFVSLHL